MADAESDPVGAPATDGSATPAPGGEADVPGEEIASTEEPPVTDVQPPDDPPVEEAAMPPATDEGETSDTDGRDSDETEPDVDAEDEANDVVPDTLGGHVTQVVGAESDLVRLLDADLEVLEEASATDAFDAIKEADAAPTTVILDDELTQRVLDVAAQLGVGRVIARDLGEFTKRPTGVRVLTAAQLEPA